MYVKEVILVGIHVIFAKRSRAMVSKIKDHACKWRRFKEYEDESIRSIEAGLLKTTDT